MRVGVTLLTMLFAFMVSFAQFTVAAELTKPTRRAFLFGTGATAVTLITPKKLVVEPQPSQVYEFTVPRFGSGLFPSKLTPEEELSIFRHVIGQNFLPYEAEQIMRSLEKSRRFYRGGLKTQQVLVDRSLIPQMDWQPVQVHDLSSVGKWINGFVKFLSRKTFEQALASPVIEQAKSPSEALATIQQIEFQNAEAQCNPLLTNPPQGELLIIEDDK